MARPIFQVREEQWGRVMTVKQMYGFVRRLTWLDPFTKKYLDLEQKKLALKVLPDDR